MTSRRGENHESCNGGFGIAVKMEVTDASSPQAEPEPLVEEGHEPIGSYSHATRNNVAVDFVDFVGAHALVTGNARHFPQDLCGTVATLTPRQFLDRFG